MFVCVNVFCHGPNWSANGGRPYYRAHSLLHLPCRVIIRNSKSKRKPKAQKQTPHLRPTHCPHRGHPQSPRRPSYWWHLQKLSAPHPRRRQSVPGHCQCPITCSAPGGQARKRIKRLVSARLTGGRPRDRRKRRKRRRGSPHKKRLRCATPRPSPWSRRNTATWVPKSPNALQNARRQTRSVIVYPSVRTHTHTHTHTYSPYKHIHACMHTSICTCTHTYPATHSPIHPNTTQPPTVCPRARPPTQLSNYPSLHQVYDSIFSKGGPNALKGTNEANNLFCRVATHRFTI